MKCENVSTTTTTTREKPTIENLEGFAKPKIDDDGSSSRKKNPLKEEFFEFAIPEREVDEQKYFFSNLKNTSNSS